MNELQIWHASKPTELQAWLGVWSTWSEREPAAHPTYSLNFASASQEVLCIYLNASEGAVLFPLILRPIAAEPWGAISSKFDATGPYGYGGPFILNSTDPAALALRFWSLFRDWAAAGEVVSLFSRLSLFDDQRLPWPEDSAEITAQNLVRTCDDPLEVIWRDYRKKVRKNVNRARRDDLTVEIDLHGARLDEFLAIYEATMSRNNASAGYYFSREFFESITRIPNGAIFFHVLSGDQVVSTELVLSSKHHLYSFLGGTLPEFFPSRPNDLLKHAIVEWGHEQGKTHFVLGGGYTANDGIFLYKKAFAPSGEVPFFTGRLLLDQAGSDALVAARRAWSQKQRSQEQQEGQAEAEETSAWEAREGFFPAYRA